MLLDEITCRLSTHIHNADQGPKSVEVIRTAREEGFLAVRGNHDNFALAAYTGTGRFAKDPTPRQSGSGGGGVEAPPLPPSWVSHMSR